jgi:hypothetical protein
VIQQVRRASGRHVDDARVRHRERHNGRADHARAPAEPESIPHGVRFQLQSTSSLWHDPSSGHVRSCRGARRRSPRSWQVGVAQMDSTKRSSHRPAHAYGGAKRLRIGRQGLRHCCPGSPWTTQRCEISAIIVPSCGADSATGGPPMRRAEQTHGRARPANAIVGTSPASRRAPPIFDRVC